MKLTRVLVLAGGTVTFGAAVSARCGRARRAASRGPVAPSGPRLRLAPTLATIMLGWYTPEINWDDMFLGLGSLVVGLFGWVLDLVQIGLRRLGDALWWMIAQGFDAVEHIMDVTQATIGDLVTTTLGLAHGAYEMGKQLTILVPDAFRQALEQLQSIVFSVVEDWIPDIIRQVGANVESLVRAALGPLWDALVWLGDAWPVFEAGWDFLYALLTNPEAAIWGLIAGPFLAAAGDIIKFGLDAVWPGIVAVIDTLFQYADFLIGLITDPSGTLERFSDDISAHLLPFLRDEIAQAVERSGPAFDRYITDALGLN